MSAQVSRRTVTVTDEVAPSIVVPRGRSAAERRLAALAALHQPVGRTISGHGIVRDEVVYVCGECKSADSIGRISAARWPCTSARLMGTWPGEAE